MKNLFKYGSKSSIFGKICLNTGVNHQFSRKSAQIQGTINEKQKNEAFVGVRLMKNA